MIPMRIEQGEAAYQMLPDPAVPDPRQADAMFRRDFRASFGFVQGFVGAHGRLFDAMSAVYCQTWTQEGMQEILPEILPRGEKAIQHIQLPKDHFILPRSIVAAEANKQWERFSLFLYKRANAGPMKPSQFVDTLMDLERRVTFADTRHIARGRNSYVGEPRDDPHESHYRNYVFDGESTGSSTIDYIAQAMRQLRLRQPLRAVGIVQKEMWELYHPGKSFYADLSPEEYEAFPRGLKAKHAFINMIGRHLLRPLLVQPLAATASRHVLEVAEAKRLLNAAMMQAKNSVASSTSV